MKRDAEGKLCGIEFTKDFKKNIKSTTKFEHAELCSKCEEQTIVKENGRGLSYSLWAMYGALSWFVQFDTITLVFWGYVFPSIFVILINWIFFDNKKCDQFELSERIF